MQELQATSIDTITAEILILKRQTAENIIEIGKRLIQVKESLPHGEWGKWLEERVEITQWTANKFMRVAKELNCGTLNNLTQSKVFALLDLPQEQREEFITANPVEDMTTRELRQAINDKKNLEEQLKHLKENPVVEEKTVIPPDYQSTKEQLARLKREYDDNSTIIKRLGEDKAILERKVRLNEKEAKEYGELKRQIENLKKEKGDIGRQIQAATELSGLIVRVENLLKNDLAPVKYSRAIDEQRNDDVVQKNLMDIVSRVREWVDDMEVLINNKNYIDVEAIVNE